MNELRVLIVGAGSMGRGWGRTIRDCPDCQIVGWVDIDREASERGAAELELTGVVVGDDLGKMLAETRPDFVVDVTIPSAHHDVTLQALAAGIPVLGEKPMAPTMAEARAMVAASEAAGKLYMVSQSRRYDNRLRAYKRLIDNHLGTLGILNSTFYLSPRFGGFRDEMDSPLIVDMAIHTFDAARYLSGCDPVSVYCEEFNPSWSWYKGNACATAIFAMENGLRYTYTGSWCADGNNTSWDADWRAVGERGTALWDGHGSPTAEVLAGQGSDVERVVGVVEDMHGGIAGSLREFIQALKTGSTPMGECHDNIKSLAMVLATVESARSGARVMIADVLK